MILLSPLRSVLATLGFVALSCLLGPSTLGSQESSTSKADDPPIAFLGGVPLACSSFQDFARQGSSSFSRPHQGETEEMRNRRIFNQWVIHLALLRESEVPSNTSDLEVSWARMRRKILGQAFLRELTAGLSIASEEVEAFYRTHPERFRRRETIATRWILRKLPSDASPEEEKEARNLLEDLRRQVLAGASLGALARRYSEAENANRGGAVASSHRGRLLKEYEAVAWSLEPGQLSPVVRLPQGLALIRLEKIFPPMERSLEDARGGIEGRLLEQKSQALLDETLQDARKRWPITLDLAHDRIRFLHEVLTLEDLGLGHRPPRLEEKIDERMRSRWLELMALEAGLENRPNLVQRLAFQRDFLRAAREMDRRVQSSLVDAPEVKLRALYRKQKASLRDPERRTFEIRVIRGESGAMRRALAHAEKVAENWRRPGPWRAPTLERWGPLTEQQLGASTSPRLAKAAFALEIGAVSDPVLLEDYNLDRIVFEAEGYAILRLIHLEPRRSLGYEEVRDRLRRDATRREAKVQRRKIRSGILADASVLIHEGALRQCSLGGSVELIE